MKHSALIQNEFCKTAVEFGSQKEMDSYLKKHPKADRRKHKVVKSMENVSQIETDAAYWTAWIPKHLQDKFKKFIENSVVPELDPSEKSTYMMQRLQENAVKKYLTNLAEYVKKSLNDVKVEFTPEFTANQYNTGDIEFAQPFIVNGEKFKLGMKVDYPKIRCTHIQSGSNLDSQKPSSLLKKIREGLPENKTSKSPFSSKSFKTDKND